VLSVIAADNEAHAIELANDTVSGSTIRFSPMTSIEPMRPRAPAALRDGRPQCLANGVLHRVRWFKESGIGRGGGRSRVLLSAQARSISERSTGHLGTE